MKVRCGRQLIWSWSRERVHARRRVASSRELRTLRDGGRRANRVEVALLLLRRPLALELCARSRFRNWSWSWVMSRAHQVEPSFQRQAHIFARPRKHLRISREAGESFNGYPAQIVEAKNGASCQCRQGAHFCADTT